MALENFDAAREYLARHQIHRLFEDCTEDLVINRPAEKEGITKSIISRVDAVREAKRQPTTSTILCIGLDENKIEAALEPALRGKDDAVVLRTPIPGGHSALDLQKTVSHIRTAATKNVFVTGFPASLAQAMTYESLAGDIKRAVLFIPTGYDSKTHMPTDTNSAEYKQYLKKVHPIATYYQALEKLTVCYYGANSGDHCVAAIVQKLTS